MNEAFSYRINGWQELLKLNREDAFSYFNEMNHTLKEYWDMDQKNENPRPFEEWCLVTQGKSLAECADFNRQHRQQFYDKD